MMATVFFLHLTCFDTRRRSTAKTKLLPQNVRQSAGVRCGAARKVDSCESGNYRCPQGQWGGQQRVSFWKYTTAQFTTLPSATAGGTCTFQATPTLALFIFRCCCWSRCFFFYFFFFIVYLVGLVVASVCCCFSY